MDTAKVLIDAMKPNSFLGKAKLFGAVSVVGSVAFIYGTNWISDKFEEKHRLTVCWEHYRLFKRGVTLSQIYTPKETRKFYSSYQDCIDAARKKAPIPPLAS